MCFRVLRFEIFQRNWQAAFDDIDGTNVASGRVKKNHSALWCSPSLSFKGFGDYLKRDY